MRANHQKITGLPVFNSKYERMVGNENRNRRQVKSYIADCCCGSSSFRTFLIDAYCAFLDDF